MASLAAGLIQARLTVTSRRKKQVDQAVAADGHQLPNPEEKPQFACVVRKAMAAVAGAPNRRMNRN